MCLSGFRMVLFKDNISFLNMRVVNQFLDRTNKRKHTFFEEGIVAHVAFAQPVCSSLAKFLYQAAKEENLRAHFGGTYINIEGPQFSTLAESNLYRSWGMDIIGMTNATEARLAREAEICYATLAAVTDYDCWHETEETVSVEAILENLKQNISNAKKILLKTIAAIPSEEKCACNQALQFAMVTNPDIIPKEIKEKLEIIIGKYLK